jgi:hypothetical protein
MNLFHVILFTDLHLHVPLFEVDVVALVAAGHGVHPLDMVADVVLSTRVSIHEKGS